MPRRLITQLIVIVATSAGSAHAADEPSEGGRGEEVVEAQRAHAVALAHEQRWSDALDLLGRVLSATPDDAEAHYLRAGIHVALAGRDTSRAAIDEAGETVHAYSVGAAHLAAAKIDLERYLTLKPFASDEAAVRAMIVQLTLREEVALSAQAVADRRRTTVATQRTWAYVLGGTGLGVVAASVGLTLLASSSKASIETGGLATSSDISSAASATRTYQGASYVGYGVGGSLVLVAVAMILFGPPALHQAASSTSSVAGAKLFQW